MKGGFVMLIDISSVKKETGSSMQISEKLDLTDYDPAFSEVSVEGKIRNIAGVLTFKAEMKGRYDSVCDRCLAPAQVDLTAHVDTIFDGDCAKDDSVTFENGKIDISKTVYDALALELPIRILCSEDCKGICPGCGADLNHEECRCHKDGETQ